MTTITTVAELDALAEGCLVVDRDADLWVKTGRLWRLVGNTRNVPDTPEFLLAQYGPVQCDHEAAPPSPLNMTRCAGSDTCMTTTALPAGASWRCAEHTTRGN